MVGLQPSTTRFHLDLLVTAGLVECSADRRSAPGRPALRYRERPARPAEQVDAPVAPTRPGALLEDNYQQLAAVLASSMSQDMDPSRAARLAGRRWSHELNIDDPMPAGEPVQAVVDLMDKLGFAPDRPTDRHEIRLRRCPFEVVARDNRQVVCGVHAGMLEETFARLGGPVRVAELAPFVNNEPLLCVVRLKRTAARASSRQAKLTREGVASPRSSQAGPDRPGEQPHA
jgi:predicted ArsR family transcriptional regulator